VFVPKRFLNYTVVLWTVTILINYYFTNNPFHCWVQAFEWRNSNCENYAILHEVLDIFSIDKKYSKLGTTILYLIFVIVIIIRCYIQGVEF